MALAFKLVTGAAAMSSLLVVLAGHSPPVPPEPVPDAIAERWLPEGANAPKADRLPLAAAADDFPAEVVAPAPVVAAARTDVLQTVGATVSARRHTARNVCTRHGMRKVSIRGGRSWRCRR